MKYYIKYLLSIGYSLVYVGKLNIKSTLRHFKNWKRYQIGNYSTLDERLPWMTFASVDYLKENVQEQSIVFEYGMGGSTLFWLDKKCIVNSVEHDAEWFESLNKKIKLAFTEKQWIANLVLPQPKTGVDREAEEFYTTQDALKDNYFKNYVLSIEKFNDKSIDVVVIDGRSRDACMYHAMPKVKAGGLLVLDNSDRKYYFKYATEKLKSDFEIVLDGASPTVCNTTFTRTTIWRKIR